MSSKRIYLIKSRSDPSKVFIVLILMVTVLLIVVRTCRSASQSSSLTDEVKENKEDTTKDTICPNDHFKHLNDTCVDCKIPCGSTEQRDIDFCLRNCPWRKCDPNKEFYHSEAESCWDCYIICNPEKPRCKGLCPAYINGKPETTPVATSALLLSVYRSETNKTTTVVTSVPADQEILLRCSACPNKSFHSSDNIHGFHEEGGKIKVVKSKGNTYDIFVSEDTPEKSSNYYCEDDDQVCGLEGEEKQHIEVTLEDDSFQCSHNNEDSAVITETICGFSFTPVQVNISCSVRHPAENEENIFITLHLANSSSGPTSTVAGIKSYDKVSFKLLLCLKTTFQGSNKLTDLTIKLNHFKPRRNKYRPTPTLCSKKPHPDQDAAPPSSSHIMPIIVSTCITGLFLLIALVVVCLCLKKHNCGPFRGKSNLRQENLEANPSQKDSENGIVTQETGTPGNGRNMGYHGSGMVQQPLLNKTGTENRECHTFVKQPTLENSLTQIKSVLQDDPHRNSKIDDIIDLKSEYSLAEMHNCLSKCLSNCLSKCDPPRQNEA